VAKLRRRRGGAEDVADEGRRFPNDDYDRAATILVVDDDPDCREITARLLEREGHRTRRAASGETACASRSPSRSTWCSST